MDWLLITLRLVHVGLGAFWVGAMLLNVIFLMPAIRDAGPAGGAVMAGLQRRRMMVWLPIIALLTILSGYGLIESVWGGPAYMFTTPSHVTFTMGAVAAIIAFLLGIGVLRPAMMRSMRLMGEMEGVPEAERAARMAEVTKLRARGTVAANGIAVLLVIALGAMAIGRYV